MTSRPLSRASTDSVSTAKLFPGSGGASVTSNSNNIKVVARFRPESDAEKSIDGSDIIASFLNEETCQIDTAEFNGTFTFDRVFDPSCSQSEVFEFSLRQTVDDLFKGYNGTVLAYGQTGSGKSYTMMGPTLEDDNLRGAIPRIVDLIFEMIEQSPNEIEYIVRVCYMEIYMEKIKDLLAPDNDNLPIHEDKNRGVYVKGLTEEYVSSAREVYDVMKRGVKARAVGSTNMNTESSRSHSIFGIVVSQKNVSTGSQKSGQLFLVDLAGSEKVVKTGASGQTLEEAKKINKSLSALGNVINALTDGKSSHVPYRDSKLTRILQESLGGNSRTSLIVNCSPSSYNDQETISTLRFGVRAKTIKNRAKINSELSSSEMKAILRSIQSQLDQRVGYEQKLEHELSLWRGGNVPAKSDWVEFMPAPTVLNNDITPVLSRSLSTRSETGGARTPVLKKLRNNVALPPDSPGWPMSPQRDSVLDPIDEFMQRENEYQDSLAQKDSLIDSLQRELESKSTKAVDFERLEYEKKELMIQSGSLQNEVLQLRTELNNVNQDAIDLRVENEGLKSELESAISSKSRLSLASRQQLEDDSNTDSTQKVPLEVKTILSRQDAKFWETASTYQKITDDEQLKSFYEESLELKNDTIASLTQEIQRLKLSQTAADITTELVTEKSTAASRDKIQAMQAHIAEFESLKQALMKDLQNRCERIVELEIALDDVRQQYNMLVEKNNNQQQQRKVAILERNLNQLTKVQQQVLAQNQSLKKEIAVSRKLLESRNQRIKELESSLELSRTMLTREQNSYESRLGYLKERMNEMKTNRGGSVNVGLKIVKPLRGGGTGGSSNAENMG